MFRAFLSALKGFKDSIFEKDSHFAVGRRNID
jgi:hypothetical protein